MGRYSGVALSPDDSRVATAKEIVGSKMDQDIWVLETSRPTSTRITFGPVLEDLPVWSADGRTLMFTNGGDTGNLFAQAADGEPNARMLLSTKLQHKIPTSASSDGRFLLYTALNMDSSRNDIWVLPLIGASKPFALVQRDFDQAQGQFSPDGRWVAYASNESGRYEYSCDALRSRGTVCRPIPRPLLCPPTVAQRLGGAPTARSSTSSLPTER